MKKKILFALSTMMLLLVLASCGNLNKEALHISYSEDEHYGTGDYLFSTVTFSGSAFDSDTTYSVKELEELACDNKDMSHEGLYSMLTRGSIFSQHEMSGIKLYDLIEYAGLNENLGEDINVKLISRDGYVTVIPLEEIKNSNDNTYNSMEDNDPVEQGVPVILAFGSDGVPLTGPVGVKQPGEEISTEEGYDENAENVGGPVRLIGGQKSPDEYNAPDNAKWIKEVVVGDDTNYDLHKGNKAGEKCLDVSVVNKDGSIADRKSFTYADIEACDQKEDGFYGEDYYKGVNFWGFLASSMDFASREGSVKLTFADGSYQEIDMEYFRNIKGDYSKYTASKDGLTISALKPALGYCVNDTPSQNGVYALLPKVKGYTKKTVAEAVISIEIKLSGEDALSENPYGGYKIAVTGDGVEEEGAVTVNQMESYVDLMVSDGTQQGVSLAGLLKEVGVAVDVEKVTVIGDRKITYTWDDLETKSDSLFLTTRENGKPPEKGGPVKMGEVNNVKEIIVKSKDGQWTHDKKPYTKFQSDVLKISGSAVNKAKNYTLAELEEATYTVRDSFAASNGINAYQGIILRELIKENLKDGIDRPGRITVIGKDGYKTELDVGDVFEGVESKYQPGEHRDIIIAYSIDGTPLVKNEKSSGFNGENGFGPMRLVVENQTSKWVKSVAEIKVYK